MNRSTEQDGEDSGWVRKLCGNLCCMCAGPPIPRMEFDLSALRPAQKQQLKRLGQATTCLVVLSFTRVALEKAAGLSDFMGGGNALVSALLAFAALQNYCRMNGSFLVMFLIFAGVNGFLFDLLLSFGANVSNAGTYQEAAPNVTCTTCETPDPASKALAFWAEQVVVLVLAAFQMFLAYRTKLFLDEVIPGWSDIVSQSSPGQDHSGWSQTTSTASNQRPLLATQAPPPQQSFKAFSGSGQALGRK